MRPMCLSTERRIFLRPRSNTAYGHHRIKTTHFLWGRRVGRGSVNCGLLEVKLPRFHILGKFADVVKCFEEFRVGRLDGVN